jgi:hypothetical protein
MKILVLVPPYRRRFSLAITGWHCRLRRLPGGKSECLWCSPCDSTMRASRAQIHDLRGLLLQISGTSTDKNALLPKGCAATVWRTGWAEDPPRIAGASIDFDEDVATIKCGRISVLRPCAVELADHQILVRLDAGGTILALEGDGRLSLREGQAGCDQGPLSPTGK